MLCMTFSLTLISVYYLQDIKERQSNSPSSHTKLILTLPKCFDHLSVKMYQLI